MKTIHRSIFIFSLLFLTISCDKDFNTPDTNLICEMDYQEHPNSESLQNLIDSYASDGFIGMTVLIDSPGDGTWVGSSGYASIETNSKMNPCHIHHTASLYKTYISTIIMQLLDEDKISLDDKLSEYLPTEIIDKIPNGDIVSIKNLLQQRTGIPDIFEVEFITDFFNNPTKSYTIEELLVYIHDKEPLSEVDTEFHYSDANFSLLSLVIDALEGNHIEAIKERIFRPLNLPDTYFLENEDQTPSGLTDSYWDRFDNGNFENNSDIQIALTSGLRGSDGVVTTAQDLSIFIKALVNENIISDLSLMTDFEAVPTEIQEREVYSAYGLGLMNVNISGTDWFGHFGNHIGSGAIVLYNPEKEITFVALQNTGTFFSDSIKGKFFYQLISDIETIVL